MKGDDYLALLRRALSTPHGTALEFGDFHKAEWARGRLYRLRNMLRRVGDASFDNLSFVINPHGDLLIIRRDKLPRRDMEDGLAVKGHSIRKEELPDRFGYCNYSFTVRNKK